MFRIEYVGATHRGLVRSANEDAIVCGEESLSMDNGNIGDFLHEEVDLNMPRQFAVFDGLGGEQCGEVASHMAAQAFKKWQPKASKQALQTLCEEMNRSICMFTERNSLRTCGTTAAMIVADSSHIISCNLGDSRIFAFHDKKMEQISVDHVLQLSLRKKAPLTQFLGIPETELVLEPTYANRTPHDGDQYLLCSDGLTDMVSEESIACIMNQECALKKKAEKLFESAMAGGGLDNISLILLQLRMIDGSNN